MSAPMRNRLWLLPPMASAVVPSQPMVRGWVPCVSVWSSTADPFCPDGLRAQGRRA